MRFQTPLVPARLIRRYKRFLADCRLADGTGVIAHCANPGAMTGLADPGAKIWLEPNDDAKKKLDFGWRLVEDTQGHFACVDTSIANRVVGEALRAHQIAALAEQPQVRAEVRYGQASRVDFLLSGGGHPDTYVEVKSVTLCRRAGLAEFPDTVTRRGARHMEELAEMTRQGHRAVILFLILRTDCTRFDVARDIDPAYGAAFDMARDAGVEAMCHATTITPRAITIGRAIPVAT